LTVPGTIAYDFPKVFMSDNLTVFRGQDPGGIIWQPRLEFWYRVNKKRNTMPPYLKDASLEEVYEYCRATKRYFGKGLKQRYRNVEETEEWLDQKRRRTTWKTPVGEIRQVFHYDDWGLSGHRTEYRVKTPDDFKVLQYMLEDEEWYWDQESYESDLARYGHLGVPSFFFRRSPIQGLFINNAGFERTIYLMNDHPRVIQEYTEHAAAADDAMFEVLKTCPVDLLNFGENIDAFMDPPPIWNDHLLPYYNKRVEELHNAGKFVYIHVDGAMKPLLPYLMDCPWDAIEAATPLPQGDVTLEEIRTALGDETVLVDGIPALYFLPSYSEDDLIACTRRVVDLFYPKLILGISDEPPPDSDIERIRMVGELVKSLI
jgi:hypothetical protein